MRVFLAGASGVIGRALIPFLREAGCTVGGLTRTASKAPLLERLGAEPIVGDVYDRDRLIEAVRAFRPEVVIHELTDLPDDASRLPEKRDDNARIRIEGTRHLIEAARSAEASRFLAQSIAWTLPPGHGAEAVAELERSVLAIDGVVLRYGQLYGPGTFYPTDSPSHPRIDVQAAARRTAEALSAPSGVIEVVEREPDA